MIYFLPERVYNYLVKKGSTIPLELLKSISNKFDNIDTFEDAIKFLSMINDYSNHKQLFDNIEKEIKKALTGNSILLQECEIISTNTIDEKYINSTKALDDENYLAMIMAFIDFSDEKQKDTYFSYMKKYISYFDSHESKDYSRFIYYNYILYKILIDSTNKDFITTSMSQDDIIAKCMNTIKSYYNKALSYSDDKDNINSQFCEWVCFYIRNINQLVENNKMKIDLYPLYEKLDNFLYDEIGNYQYKKYNYGYLRFCDTMLMYCLFSIDNTNKNERFKVCKELLNKIVDLFNDGLSNMHILIRGLCFYDRIKIVKYVSLLRKYAAIAINNEKILHGKIINASPDDLKLALSSEITNVKLDTYNSNRVNSEEAIKQIDQEAELIGNFIKLLGMQNVR